MEIRRIKLDKIVNAIADYEFTGTRDYYPKLSFIKEETDINDKTDRNFYLWVLINRTPITEEDEKCEAYLKKILTDYDSKYYENLDTELLNIRKKLGLA